MPEKYPFKDIEAKWQKWWEANGIYHAKQPEDTNQKKYYGLIEFPYPSGDGLHVGHPRSYTAMDIVTRKKRMEGLNVMYPIGWDAFGLPTENAAIKKKIHPSIVTEKNINTFKRQIQALGTGFDWTREVNTTDPAYYKWTQWMFIQFFDSWFDEKAGRARHILDLHIPEEIEEQGQHAVRQYRDEYRMAFKTKTVINWCPKDKIGLANEEARGGICDRCGGPVEKREKEQWMLRITKYAERLIKGLDTVDYLDKIKIQQINWIGRSEGALIQFKIQNSKSKMQEVSSIDNINKLDGTQSFASRNSSFVIEVFTTRPDTLFGATYLVLSPEHPQVMQWLEDGVLENAKEIKKYQSTARNKSDLERQENKEKTGVELRGVTAINPATEKSIPIWIADYVLLGYGTGAIMAVPAHDERDFEFAKKFKLPIVKVVQPGDEQKVESECWSGHGIAINSGFLDGLETSKAIKKMISWLEKNKVGKAETTYKLRDWVFSRQRYWGEPIPMVHCADCGWVPVKETDLPVLLPDVKNYEPTDNGESPLAAMEDWVKTICPICGKEAKRETDTMPNWAGSSWYFLRYCDPLNKETFASEGAMKYWMPVNLYDGGMEHTTLHLLYSRFWHKLLFDLGHIPEVCTDEPYAVRRAHAMILGEGGIKMSKSKGNVVNPDDVISEYGSDVFRCYEMFMGPYDMDAPWSTKGIQGVKRFLDKVWAFTQLRIGQLADSSTTTASNYGLNSSNELRPKTYDLLLHTTIKKVGEDIDSMHFNTAISQLMVLTNELQDAKDISRRDLEDYLKILAPFAPHLTEELWHELGNDTCIHLQSWPVYDKTKIKADTFELVIQVNGKVRDKITVSSNISENEAEDTALASEKVQKYMQGKKPIKVIYIKGRLISISV